MFGHLPGTWANLIYKRLSFPVGWKQSTNTCHIRATCDESPSLAPPFCTGGWGWLTLTSPSKRQTWTRTLFSHWGKPQNKESNFLKVRYWVFWKQECLCHGKCPLPITKIISPLPTKIATYHISLQLQRTDRQGEEQENSHVEGGEESLFLGNWEYTNLPGSYLKLFTVLTG